MSSFVFLEELILSFGLIVIFAFLFLLFFSFFNLDPNDKKFLLSCFEFVKPVFRLKKAQDKLENNYLNDPIFIHDLEKELNILRVKRCLPLVEKKLESEQKS